ncbi:MAG: hypothetical protein ACWGPS_02600 [Candidatus Promineifilaceae bacterium]
MARILNQFSFLFLAIPVIVLALFLLVRGDGARWKQVLSILLFGLLVIGYLYLRPGSSASTASEARAALVAADKPVLLEVYSDY